jgi:SPP1 gp7 family putative phage head morphogenesis protein
MNEFKAFDSMIFHRVLVEGQKNRISNVVLKNLQIIITELKKYIKNRENNSILKLQSEISKFIEENYNKLQSEFVNELQELLDYESDYQNEWLNKTVEETPENNLLTESAAIAGLLLISKSVKLSRKETRNIIDKRPVRGATFKEQINQQKYQLKEMVRRNVVTGINDNASDEEIIAEVQKTFNKNKAGTEAMLKTVVNAHTNEVAIETYKKNGFKNYKYVSIMDDKTTEICSYLNGQVFEIDKGPLPPQHYGCRSFVIPVIIKNGEVTEFKEFSNRKGDVRITTNEKGNFKKNNNFDFSLSKMKKEEYI